jgi:hypothetical protein
VLALERRFTSKRGFVADPAALDVDGVGPAIAAPLIRIVLMQVAVIFGAMMVRKFGTDVPFYILIGLKCCWTSAGGLRRKPNEKPPACACRRAAMVIAGAISSAEDCRSSAATSGARGARP